MTKKVAPFINTCTAMPLEHQSPLIKHFLAHQRTWGVSLLLLWMTVNILVLATSVIMEHGRNGLQIPFWVPFCWEITSVVMILFLIPVIIFCVDKLLYPLRFGTRLFAHILLTIPFSLIHVGGMVMLRKAWYWLLDAHYYLGDLPYELIYEYRKDAQSYFTILVVIYGYRFIVRRLRGEASIITDGEDAPEKTQPERLLVKKLGKEFLIHVQDIEWIEAAGNYANLHIGQSLYPMRITMASLEKSLPAQKFARIHRSSIVNLNQVKTLLALETGDYELTLISGESLSLSRRYRERFKDLLSMNSENTTVAAAS